MGRINDHVALKPCLVAITTGDDVKRSMYVDYSGYNIPEKDACSAVSEEVRALRGGPSSRGFSREGCMQVHGKARNRSTGNRKGLAV